MNKNFTMDIATTVPASYLHFNLYIRDTKILLEPLDQDERECLLEDRKNNDICNYPNTEKLPTENHLQRIKLPFLLKQLLSRYNRFPTRFSVLVATMQCM